MDPAAVLSVLVEANSSTATATLTKFDKQLAATNEVARKGIDARLGGTLNDTAFKAYDERLARAARVASDRAAFKAELGANFNNTAFNAYERGVDKALLSQTALVKEGSRIGDSFTKGTEKAGGALSKLAAIGASFGIPFTEGLERVGDKL